MQESTSCTPALLILGLERVFDRPPDTPAVLPGLEYTRILQDRLKTAYVFACDQLHQGGMRQKTTSDVMVLGSPRVIVL